MKKENIRRISSGANFFRLPASKAKDNQDHYFYFKINSDDEWEFYKFDDREKDPLI